jgi:hypothetical protein
MVAGPPVRLRLKILGRKLDRAVASRAEQGLAELDDLAYRVPTGLWLSEQRAGALEGVAPARTVPGQCGNGSGEPVLVGVGHGLGSVADTGLGEEMIDVALYCGLADHQPVGDLQVR